MLNITLYKFTVEYEIDSLVFIDNISTILIKLLSYKLNACFKVI